MSSTTVGVLVIAGAFILLSITGDRRYSLTKNLGFLGLILLLGLALFSGQCGHVPHIR